MTLAEVVLGTQRINEMEEKKKLPEETIRELKKWCIVSSGRRAREGNPLPNEVTKFLTL